MKRILNAVIAATIALSFTSCELLQRQASSEQTAVQLNTIQQKAFDAAMKWLDKFINGMAGASRLSPEDQFVKENKQSFMLDNPDATENDMRVGFRAARLQHK